MLTGSPFEFNVNKHDDKLLEAAEDFWRDFMYKHQNTEEGEYYISKLLDIAETPAELIDNLSDLFEKPYAKIEGEVLDEPIKYLNELLTIKKEFLRVWNQEKKSYIRSTIQ